MNEDVVAEAPKAGTAAARQAAAARPEGVTSLTARRLAESSSTEENSRILSGISELDRVLGGGSVLAVQNVAPKETNKYGIVGVDDELKQTSCVRTMVEKPAPEAAPSTLAVIGRYVLEPEIFTALEHVDRGVGGEIQLTDAIASLLGEGKTYAHRFEGRRFDCGSKQGFLTATAHYARVAGYDFI